MINLENNDLYDLNEALKIENLTISDYEEICRRLNKKVFIMMMYLQNLLAIKNKMTLGSEE